jgi:hypothetical protein
MITFIEITGTPPAPTDNVGPLTSNVSLPTTALNGSMSAGLTASVSDVNTGNSNVTEAEYFIDTTGAGGTGTDITGGAYGFPGPVAVSETIPAATIGALSSGNHTVYVRGLDSAGNWGSFALGVLKVDNDPPITTNLGLSPNPTNGTVDVSLTATGNDTATGNSNIIAAEYWIDAGAPVAMTVGIQAPIAGLSATIPAAVVNALAAGPHTVSIHSMDAMTGAVWGPTATITLNVDKTGPVTSPVTAAPNPNNGTLPINSTNQAVRVTATFTDADANIAAGEGFFNTIGATGTGFVFIANDGNFNTSPETGHADIPLAVIAAYPEGTYTIHVHGKDSAGNWGSMGTATLTIDKTPPTVLSINRTDPNPTGAPSVGFLVTFSDSVTGVTSGNFTVVTTGSVSGASILSVSGTGATRTVTVSTGSGGGTVGLNLTSATGIKDVAGNAMSSTGLPFVGQVYTKTGPPIYFSTSGNGTVPGVASPYDDSDIYFHNGTSFSRIFDANVSGSIPMPAGANVDGFERIDNTHFYMSFNGSVTLTGPGTVQDEDIVYYNAGVWTLAFDGSANGLAGAFATDIDAFSIVGGAGGVITPGNLYFSTDNDTPPPSATGGGDDADIFRWNTAGNFTRMINATGGGSIGLATGADVDGFVWVDATHFYMSFNTDQSVPGLGTVQDEDVVYYNSGTWLVYFDGTAAGLTPSGDLDIDAFDLP